jgi:hypothetical protein
MIKDDDIGGALVRSQKMNKILAVESEGNRPIGRSKCGWEDQH